MLRNVGTVAKESYREEKGGSFTHKGKTYNLNRVFAYIEQEKIPVTSFDVSKLAWVLEHAEPDPARVATADLKAPIIVVGHFNNEREFQPAAIDGLHRVAKAVRDKVEFIDGYRITLEQLKESQALVAIESEAPLYMDVSESLPPHLLTATHTAKQGGLLASTQTSMLKPGIDGVHLTTQVNGVYVAVNPVDTILPLDQLRYPRSIAGIEDSEIENLTITGQETLDVEHIPLDGKYYVLGPYPLFVKLMRQGNKTFRVRVVQPA